MRDVRVSLRDVEPSSDPRSSSVFGPWRYLFALAGPLFAAGGIYAAVREDALLGAGVVVMGIAFSAIFLGEQAALEHTGATTEILELEGGQRHAAVFRHSRARLTWFAIASGCAGVLGIIGLVAAPQLVDPPEDPMFIRVAAGVIGVVGVAAAVGFVRARTRNFIALTPEGFWAAGALGLVHIPWDEIVDAGLFNVPGQRGTRHIALGIGVRDRSSIRDKKVLGVLSGFDRALHGWDISFSVTTMGFDPSILVAGIDRYRSDAGTRSNIGRPDELEQLKKMVP